MPGRASTADPRDHVLKPWPRCCRRYRRPKEGGDDLNRYLEDDFPGQATSLYSLREMVAASGVMPDIAFGRAGVYAMWPDGGN